MRSAWNQILRRSVTAACLCEPEAFENGIIRGAAVKYNDSAALRLRRRALLKWSNGSPSKVLIVKKPKNPDASTKLKEIGTWLTDRGMEVYVERVVWATEFKEFSVFNPQAHCKDIDFVITLGGDGTVLHMTSLFEEDEPLPPVLCFAMGSLGFLTPFDAANFGPTLERVLDTASQPLFCTLRTRKRCEVVYDGQLEAVHHVLNECVIDRGAFPGAVLLEIFVDGSYVTNVEADGLIISTPSGSTAYSMSAGGPMVAPSVPCTVLTPMAPLSLSFRPIIIPESSSICVHLPTCARSHARTSFDGKKPMRVRRGNSLFFTTSLCPLPIISLGNLDTDWYEGITSKLKWNQAIRQLPSCPSPVGAQQQELCSARYADRTAAEAALAIAEYYPYPDDECILQAAASGATSAIRPPSQPPAPRRSVRANGASTIGSGSGGGGSSSSGSSSATSASSGGNNSSNGSNGSRMGGGGGTSLNGDGRRTTLLEARDIAVTVTVASNVASLTNGDGNSNGSHATSHATSHASSHASSNGESNGTCSGTCTPDEESITDSAANSLQDPEEAAAAAAATKTTVAVTVAAAALEAASMPLRPTAATARQRSGKSLRQQQEQHQHPPTLHHGGHHHHHHHSHHSYGPQHLHGQQQQPQQLQQQQQQTQLQPQVHAQPPCSVGAAAHAVGAVGVGDVQTLASPDAVGGGGNNGGGGGGRRRRGRGRGGGGGGNGHDGQVHAGSHSPARSRLLA